MALDLYTVFVAAAPEQSKKGQWIQLMARGAGTDDMYVMEVDPATGALPVSIPGGIVINDPSVGPTGSPVPAEAGYIAGINPSGDLQGVSVSATGEINIAAANPLDVNVTNASIPVSQSGTWSVDANITNASIVVTATDLDIRDLSSTTDSVSAVQSGTWSTRTLDGAGNALSSTAGALNVEIANTSVPVTQSGIWNIADITGTVSLPTGASTSALQTSGNASLTSIDGKTPALGQALDAASVPVVLTAAQLSTLTPLSTVAVTQSTSPWVVSGTVTAANDSVSLTGATPPASATYVGASVTTAAPSYTTGQMSAFSLNTAGGLRVDGSGVTQPISAASLPLPTGASTSANQTTANASLSSLDTKAVQEVLDFGVATAGLRTAAQIGNASGAADFGSGASSAQTIRVIAATDSPSPTAPAGRTYADSSFLDYSSTNITTGAWVQIDASTAATFNAITLFSGNGQVLELGTGAAAAETRVLLIPPGGIDGQLSLAIPSGTRLSLRAVTGTANTGYFTMTGFS